MHKNLGNILISLAILSLIFAIFAFFFPVQSNFIKGNIEGAMGFSKEWYTYSYTVTGGYLLLLAAVTCIYAAIQFYHDSADIRELLFWTGMSLFLLVALNYAGKTLFNSWLPGVPAEIQSALGTPYADYRTSPVRNIPQILSSACIVAFAITAVFSALKTRSRKEEANDLIKSQESPEQE